MSKYLLSYQVGFGLAAGVAAGVAVYVVHRQRKRNTKETKLNGYGVHRSGERGHPITASYSQAVSASTDLVAASRSEQLELLNRLDYVLGSITELRQEIESLRNILHGLAEDVVGEVRSHLEENQRAVRRRRYLPPRERTDSTGSSSIYFTASSGGAAQTDVESEGGYTTANAESDYDRESSRASEEEEDEVSCETVRTMRRDSDVVTDDEATMLAADPIDEGLSLLLQRSDQLHDGDGEQKREGFQLLCTNRLLYGNRQDFLWRLARSYSDMCDITEDLAQKKSYALEGKEEVEVALEKEGQSAECHKWTEQQYPNTRPKLRTGVTLLLEESRHVFLSLDNPFTIHNLPPLVCNGLPSFVDTYRSMKAFRSAFRLDIYSGNILRRRFYYSRLIPNVTTY
ncbi:regulator of microtubule dynamics protein 3 isoform X2 [Dendropsophus ebraccatus]|uniref:regulator of microtubule dynamics protein 3 isoform X2 n=1 Tax=Dendropsophus ebraccatus TaxID=150705 RepID=UPI00383190BA